jgi:hypothetical protein
MQTGRVANYAFAMIAASSSSSLCWPDRCRPMNAAGFPLLSLLTFLPLAGAVFILTLRGEEAVAPPTRAGRRSGPA